jgi:predicted transposase YbfD/YdcC
VQVKDNQPTLHRAIAEVAATAAPRDSAPSRDIGRNRDERRSVSVFAPAQALARTDWQPHVAAIIRVEREVFTRSSKTGLLHRSAETAFYISNKPLSAARAAEAIRAHWRIETTSHYSRDVTMGEDRSRIRSNPAIAARLRSFAFNILKAYRIGTLTQDRYRSALGGLDNMLEMLAIS